MLRTIVVPVFDPQDALAAAGLLDRCFSSVRGPEGDAELIVVNTTGIAEAGYRRTLAEDGNCSTACGSPDTASCASF